MYNYIVYVNVQRVLLFVLVSFLKSHFIIFYADITCSRLTDPSNGVITYTTDTTAPFDYQTTATYSCDNGFRLSAVGNTIRNCVGSNAGPGEWSGAAPICEGISTGCLCSHYNTSATAIIKKLLCTVKSIR